MGKMKDTALQYLYEKGNAFSIFLWPQCYTKWVLVSKNEKPSQNCTDFNGFFEFYI